GAGELTVKQLAEELGWYSIPVPELAVDAVAEMIGRLGFLPAQAQWITAFREPVIMSTGEARRELRWRPRHDALAAHRLRRGMSACEDIGEIRDGRRVAVVSDSTTYLPGRLIDRWRIQPVSLYVGWEGNLRPEPAYQDLDAFYAKLHASAQLPTTSQPSVGDFLACYQPLLAAGRD